MLIPHFPPQTINCACLTQIYDEKCCSLKSCKFRIITQAEIAKCLTTLACNWHYWSLPCSTMPIQICAGYSTLLITALWQVNSVRVIQLPCAWQCCSQIITAYIFIICNFSIWVIIINWSKTWMIYGLWEKMRYGIKM